MDIGASIGSLTYIQEQLQEEEEEKEQEVLVTRAKSISQYESDRFRCLLPQIYSALTATGYHVQYGIAMSFSAVLISQMELPDNDIESTKPQNAFMASVFTMVSPLGSTTSGFLMDRFGRLNTIKLGLIPTIVGWILIALSKSMTPIIVGRVFIGIGACWATNPASVYIAEIAHPKVRMSLNQLAPSYASLGLIFGYISGYYISWRIVSWITILIVIVPIIGVCFLHESPPWLMLKGRHDQARKSLNWFHKYQPQPPEMEESFAELQFKMLKKQQEEIEKRRKKMNNILGIAKEFLKPTGYKPILIMTPLFFCQEFSGIFITMFYSITFIEEAGSNINPYYASALIGLIRLVLTIANIFILKYITRRAAIMSSAIGMAIFMYISGQYTLWIKQGVSTATWVPVTSLLMYVVCSVLGLMFLPFMLISELFPLEIRGVGYTIAYSINMLFMFGSLQSYYWLIDILGGVAYLQWMFSVLSISAAVYTYFFLPETKGKKLSEVSEYFKTGWLYIGRSPENKAKTTHDTT
ncbi:facilitated trehalose transporter Tret1 [Diabrotica virgifera virgifera]|uniref:Facilitated trehalose transporter Tret1-like n=1 Tax=Diabrotica virgifera virgifera TaxID=50390 RepID=A0A6P7FD74_DIAVI|nr:facilitated trehalose transporter Tret1 [Diabrotica virgifera virgifera]XP_028131315.1 facilitated trehalose transporter Tret1 [Diabrotica virgifera virgifera]